MSTKATSLRLPVALADEIAAVARTDAEPMSEAIRTAIDKHIAERRADPDFQKRLKKLLQEQRDVLERLEI